MARFKEAIIDLDIPVYKFAAGGQKTVYLMYDAEGNYVDEFPSAKAYKEHIEELEDSLMVDTTGYTRESEVRIGEFEDCCKALDYTIERYIKLADAERGLFSIGGGGETFRDRVAVSRVYKGNRKDMEKPYHFKALKEYAIKKYNPKIVTGIESDDQISMWLYESYLKGLKSKDKSKCDRIMIDLEKDCRTCCGWHIDPEKDSEPVWVSTLEAARWCLTQAIGGDSCDHYAGLKGYGYKKAGKVLEDCKTVKELWDTTEALFKSEYGEGYEEYLEEMCRLAFMLREGDIKNDWKVLKGE